MMTIIIRGLLFLSLVCLAGFGAGCATVKPWERAELGTYIMRSDRDPLDTTFAEHVYFTREASSGGTGVGGGGCGCN